MQFISNYFLSNVVKTIVTYEPNRKQIEQELRQIENVQIEPLPTEMYNASAGIIW